MKKLHYIDVSCWDMSSCRLRLSENIWRNCTTLKSVAEACWVFLWGCRKNMKKLDYLDVSSWDVLGYPLRLQGKRKNCTSLTLILQTCWTVHWGYHKRSKKRLHDLDINSWYLFLSFDVVGGRGCGRREEIALLWRHLLRLVGSLRLSEKQSEEIALPCRQPRLGLSFEVVRKKWRNCTTLISLAETCWVVLGCQRENLKTLHYLAVNCWDLVRHLRLSGKMKELHYDNVNCSHFLGCSWMSGE